MEEKKMEKWKCTVCGYIHEGPMTPDFKCPICKQPADKFVKIEDAAAPAKNPYAGTKTEKNLWEAFAGESQARNKYTYFASVAKKAGYEQIAALFLQTAENEKEHAKLWFKALGELGDTAENLLQIKPMLFFTTFRIQPTKTPVLIKLHPRFAPFFNTF